MTQYLIEIYFLDVTNTRFIKLDEIVTYKNLKWITRGNAIGGCSFSLNIHDPKANKSNLIRYSSHVVIRERSDEISPLGVIRWFGPITKITGSYVGNNGYINIEAATYLRHFSDRYTVAKKVITNTQQAQIMWNLIDDSQDLTNGTLLVTQGTIVTSIARDRTYEYGKVAELIMNLSNLTDGNDFTFDAQVDANGNLSGVVFNTYYPKGTVREDLLPLEVGENIESIAFATMGEIFNTYTGIGAGSGSDILTVNTSNSASQLGYTRREKIYSNKDVSLQDTLQDQTDAQLNLNQTEKYDIQVTLLPNKIPLYGSYDVGDYLRLKINKGFMDFNYLAKVKEIECSVDDEGVLKVKPILSII